MLRQLGLIFAAHAGKDVLHADDSGVSLLWVFLAVGIGAGNMLAGRLSGDKVELGLVPMGAAFMGIFALVMAFIILYAA